MKHYQRTQILTVLALAATTLTAQPKLNSSNVEQVIAAMTTEEKIDLLIGCGMAMGEEVKFPGTAGRTRDIPRLGIQSAYLADGPHRLHMTRTREWDSKTYITTEIPSETNVAASFDQDAAYQLGKVIGEEVRDFGLDVLLAPGVNLMRSALCGRNNEYYSEDPVLAGKIAAGFIRGIQSKGSGTCLKHFAINNQETNRNNNDSRLSQRALRELYLKNFEIAVKESNPWSIMTSYNRAQGLYTCENVELTETILRDEWGWDGLVMSDWNAGKDAVASIKAGNDMLQPGQPRQREALLKAGSSRPCEVSVMFFSRACSLNVSSTLLITCTRSMRCTSSRSASSSSLWKSIIWLTRRNIRSTLRCMMVSVSCVSAGRLLSSTSCRSGAAMMVSGVRNSCDTLAKKLMFIVLMRFSCSCSRLVCSRVQRSRRKRCTEAKRYQISTKPISAYSSFAHQVSHARPEGC